MLGMLTGMAQAAVVNNTDQNQAKVVKEPVKAKKYVVQLGAFVDEFQALHRRQHCAYAVARLTQSKRRKPWCYS